ncbi:ATP-binding protein [Desulfurivibrio dismutans]|uniref:ATP-binding protein n=1 Tax=Desulfurivibrio dismutans TaxID=1398908 RepID=UPI0023DCB61B|nr:ATP-binding protein [Desulfurivibrio alkaliphilus]MDF1615493.1 ATP-binding protein [Desulfurivibrio alkaliphilus]
MTNDRRPLIWHLYPALLLVALLALLAVSWLAVTSVRGFYVQQVEEDLAARAYLLQAKIVELLPVAAQSRDQAGAAVVPPPPAVGAGGTLAALRAYCREAGRGAGTRITVVAPDGLVLADSEQSPEEMENHGGRPEIIAALAGNQGSDMRFSASVLYDTMYVAIPLQRDGAVVGVLRTAIPLTAVDEALAEIQRRLAASGLLIALLVVVAAWFVARRLSRPLEEMRAGAERFAAGDFAGRIAEQGAAELAALARAMNRMAGQLDRRLKTIDNQRNQLQAVFCSMADGVLTVDEQERVVELNQAGAELLAVDAEKIRGQNIRVALRNSGLQQLVSQVLRAGEPVEGEFTLLDQRGRELFCRARGARLAELTDGGSGAVLVISDVTRLRRLENLRRDFVANVSHELKTPITSIEGFAETLLDGALEEPDEARRFTAIILQQSRRLHAIVEDLLALSRLEQEGGRPAVPLQELPLLETIRAAVQICAHRARERGMPVAIESPENLRAPINPALLEQAVVNLVDNAVKYAPEGSPITIGAEEDAAEVRIMVRDQGPGIPAAALPRLFERFYRVDKGRSARMGGTGLGLAIVKHIAQAHGGRVDVTSQPGQGSVFTLHLPKKPAVSRSPNETLTEG